MKDRVAKSIFWMVWSRGFFQLLSFATTLIVARWLSPSDYGLMALAMAFVAILGLVCELGLGAAVVQFPDLDERELGFCFYLATATATAIYAVLFVAAPAIADWFNTPPLADIMRVSALVLPIGALVSVHQGLLQKRLELDRITQAEMAGGLVALGIVLTLAWTGAGVWALVFASVTRTIVQTIILFAYVSWRPGMQMGSARARTILEFSLGSLGSRTLWAVYDQSDSFVLGKVAGEIALGFYTMARDLAYIPVTRISSIVNQLSVPLMANLQSDVAAMRNVLLRGLRLTASVSVPVCVGVALVADDLVAIALSEKWTPIVPILRILCALSLIKSIDVLIAPILRARYRVKFLVLYNLLLVGVMPIAFLVGARAGGGVGVALAWLIVYPVVMSRMALEAFREIDLDWWTFLRQLRGPVVAAAAMAFVVLVIRLLLEGSGWAASFVRLLVASVVGAMVYVGLLWLWAGPFRDELREVMAWVFKVPRRVARRGRVG